MAFALSAGGEGWAADPSSGHFGEVSPEEPKEPWPVVGVRQAGVARRAEEHRQHTHGQGAPGVPQLWCPVV